MNTMRILILPIPLVLFGVTVSQGSVLTNEQSGEVNSERSRSLRGSVEDGLGLLKTITGNAILVSLIIALFTLSAKN